MAARTCRQAIHYTPEQLPIVDDAITHWIEELKQGDAAAAEKLWQRYFQQIVELARRRLDGAKRGAADEEDVALSVFKSLCLGAPQGKFPALTDRDSLWSLLVAITVHKSVDLVRHENRKKRGGTGKPATEGNVREISVNREFTNPLSQCMQQAPTPSMIVQLEEQLSLLLEELKRAEDPDLIKVALAKMQGSSTQDIARQLGCVRRTVERKVVVIRRIWEQQCQ